MHLTSLPSRFGNGDLGPGAYAYADWLARAGFSVWQMLPIGPVGYGDSPYSSPSSFAIEPLFLALEPLVEQGLLSAADLKLSPKDAKRLGEGNCDFAASRALASSADSAWMFRSCFSAVATWRGVSSKVRTSRCSSARLK